MISAVCLALARLPAFTLVFGGDVMLNGVPVGSKPLAGVRSILESGNAALANLEIPLTQSKSRTTAKSPEEIKQRTQFVLKADPRHASHLSQVGIDLVSLANNHAMDYGRDGLAEMRRVLAKACIRFAGAGSSQEQAMLPTIYTTRQGVRVGLISGLGFVGPKAIGKLTPAGPNAPGINAISFGGVLNDRSKQWLQDWISQARQECDVLVVGIHWGKERKTEPTVWQVALGRACVDAGADVVWGHHPHVLQGAELYKGKPILYSMGNLISALPSQTALARIYFAAGKPPKFKLLPCQVAKGKVTPLRDDPCQRAVLGFKLLSQRVQKLYPSKESKPLF